jgi:hypothetical protein
MTTKLSKNLSLLVGLVVVVDCDPLLSLLGKENVVRRGCSITKMIVMEFVQMGFISNLGED